MHTPPFLKRFLVNYANLGIVGLIYNNYSTISYLRPLDHLLILFMYRVLIPWPHTTHINSELFRDQLQIPMFAAWPAPWREFSMQSVAKLQGSLTYICVFSQFSSPFYLKYQKNWKITDGGRTADRWILGAGGREVCRPNSTGWPRRPATTDPRIDQRLD